MSGRRPKRVRGEVVLTSRDRELGITGLGAVGRSAQLSRALIAAGYGSGARVVIMTLAEAKELDRAWEAALAKKILFTRLYAEPLGHGALSIQTRGLRQIREAAVTRRLRYQRR
jgi:hypothetical protein